MTNDAPLHLAAEFLQARGRFAIRSRYAGDWTRDFQMCFLPLLRSLDDAGQRGIVDVMAQVALEQVPELPQRQEAAHLLFHMVFPWPEDHRRLLSGPKERLLRDFTDEANLEAWIAAEHDHPSTNWRRDTAHALWLYWVLLTVATDAELEAPVRLLLSTAHDRKFREILRRYALLRDGTRLSSARQISEDDFRRQAGAVYRNR